MQTDESRELVHLAANSPTHACQWDVRRAVDTLLERGSRRANARGDAAKDGMSRLRRKRKPSFKKDWYIIRRLHEDLLVRFD